MRRVGIVAALPGELAPLVHGWQRKGSVFAGTIPAADGSSSLAPELYGYAAAAGMGTAAATRAFSLVTAAAAADGRRLDAVVSFGWAGAISCGVKPPDVHTIAQVIDSRTGERFSTCTGPPRTGAPLRLVTLDHVARADEKRPLAERYQAVLVDMEASAVARLAQAHQLEFYCLKAISDGYTDVLPDFNPFLNQAGQLRLGPFVASVLLRPRYWAALARLGARSKAAARNLKLALPACLETTRLVS